MRDIYSHIGGQADMRRVFRDIRRDVAVAGSRPILTELYRRAGYLITLTYAPSWQDKFGRRARQLRKVAEDEFRITAQLINRRAELIGTSSDYHEIWGQRRSARRVGGPRRTRSPASKSGVRL